MFQHQQWASYVVGWLIWFIFTLKHNWEVNKYSNSIIKSNRAIKQKLYYCDYNIWGHLSYSRLFPYVTNLWKWEKCVTYLICVGHFLWFEKFLIQDNTECNLCIFNNLGYKSAAEKSKNKIIGHLKNLYNHVYLVKGKFSLENNLWNTWKKLIYTCKWT